jgi:hypothetical protein
LVVLLQGYADVVLAAFVLTALAVSTQLGRDVLAMLTAKFTPAAGHCAAAGGAALIRPGTRQLGLRAGVFGASPLSLWGIVRGTGGMLMLAEVAFLQ